MKPAQRIALSALPFLLAAVCAFYPQGVFAQSILLSNLKTSEQTVSRYSGRRSISRRLPPQRRIIPDPFLRSNRAPTPPPRVSSILQSPNVPDNLITQRSNSATGAHEDLDALLWLRTSAEFDALTRQTFVAATKKLGEALVDSNWNALVPAERAGASPNPKPPCVIVDVDETMLDNSVFQVERIRTNTEFDSNVWNQFVQRRSSPAIEGAREFARACRTSGVRVFFVTNREAQVESATRDNLISQGLMAASDPDQILSKNERRGWTSDKANRRQAVASKYRVLLLVGDDLNDFLSAKNLTIAQRKQLYQANQRNWGQSWFVMPNPNYGGWEQAAYGNSSQSPLMKKRERKMQTLSNSP